VSEYVYRNNTYGALVVRWH